MPTTLPAGSQALTVLKIGGELIESAERAAALAPAIARLASEAPLIVVHGGGRDIDAEMARRGLAKHAVDGLRVTDAPTLDAVVAALAGTVNTRLVAALVTAGVPAVGLTGADALTVRATPAPPHQAVEGRLVDLGLVGEPAGTASPRLLRDLLSLGYVPVLACLGCSDRGLLLNINADTLAAAVARQCSAGRLIIAGATAGVLAPGGATLPTLDLPLLEAMIADGRASAGMVAKLRACRDALGAGVAVSIVDGTNVASFSSARGTRMVAGALPDVMP
jgi:acetylglutamate kinase